MKSPNVHHLLSIDFSDSGLGPVLASLPPGERRGGRLLNPYLVARLLEKGFERVGHNVVKDGKKYRPRVLTQEGITFRPSVSYGGRRDERPGDVEEFVQAFDFFLVSDAKDNSEFARVFCIPAEEAFNWEDGKVSRIDFYEAFVAPLA